MKTQRWAFLLTALLALLYGPNAQAFYNPSTGRWLSRDPIAEPGFALLNTGSKEGFGGDPNLYVFVANNPLIRVDRLGLDYAPPIPPSMPFYPPPVSSPTIDPCVAGCVSKHLLGIE